MSYIIDFIKKFLAIKEVITAIIISLNVAFYVALGAFIVEIIRLLVNLHGIIKDLHVNIISATLASHDSLNDYNAIAWSVLHSYGVVDVFNTFLSLIFSTFTMYFTLFGSRVILSYKRKMISALQEVAMILGH